MGYNYLKQWGTNYLKQWGCTVVFGRNHLIKDWKTSLIRKQIIACNGLIHIIYCFWPYANIMIAVNKYLLASGGFFYRPTKHILSQMHFLGFVFKQGIKDFLIFCSEQIRFLISISCLVVWATTIPVVPPRSRSVITLPLYFVSVVSKGAKALSWCLSYNCRISVLLLLRGV